jgi:hypothetical protein
MSDTRGGGKTDGVLGKWALKERRYGSAFNAIMFRKTTVSAEDAIERSHEIYAPHGSTPRGCAGVRPTAAASALPISRRSKTQTNTKAASTNRRIP